MCLVGGERPLGSNRRLSLHVYSHQIDSLPSHAATRRGSPLLPPSAQACHRTPLRRRAAAPPSQRRRALVPAARALNVAPGTPAHTLSVLRQRWSSCAHAGRPLPPPPPSAPAAQMVDHTWFLDSAEERLFKAAGAAGAKAGPAAAVKARTKKVQ